jgi:hypothetical protein
MIRAFILVLFSTAIFSCAETKIKIIERGSAMLVEPGYYLSESDSTFMLKGHKYLIKTREYFDDNGEITHVSIWKSEGYLDFYKKEFTKLKNFLTEHNFSNITDASIIDDKHIIINSKTIEIITIDKGQNQIYYKVKGENNIIYRLLYK